MYAVHVRRAGGDAGAAERTRPNLFVVHRRGVRHARPHEQNDVLYMCSKPLALAGTTWNQTEPNGSHQVLADEGKIGESRLVSRLSVSRSDSCGSTRRRIESLIGLLWLRYATRSLRRASARLGGAKRSVLHPFRVCETALGATLGHLGDNSIALGRSSSSLALKSWPKDCSSGVSRLQFARRRLLSASGTPGAVCRTQHGA